MRENKALLVATLVATMGMIVVLTYLAATSPMIMVAVMASIAGIVGLVLIGDWWRRLYLIMLLAMAAGSSSIPELSSIPGTGKAAALFLLLGVTYLTTRRKRAYYTGRLHKAIMITLWITVGMAFLTVIWTQFRSEVLIQALTFAAFTYILQRVSTVRWRDKKKLAGDIGVAYIASLLPILAGLAMSAAGMEEAVLWNGRHQGFYSNPNMLGLMGALAFTIGIAYASHKRSVLIWISLIAPLAAVALSGSRTSLIAVVVAAAWIIVRGSFVRVFYGSCIAALVFIFDQMGSLGPIQKTLERFNEYEGGDVLNQRSTAWQQITQASIDDGLGIGWGATQTALETLESLGNNPVSLDSVHSSYFQMLYEIGWIAVPLAVALIVLLALVALTARTKGIGNGLVATAVAGSLIHITESAIFGTGQPYPYLFWFAVIAALVVSEGRPIPVSRSRRSNRASGTVPAQIPAKAN